MDVPIKNFQHFLISLCYNNRLKCKTVKHLDIKATTSGSLEDHSTFQLDDLVQTENAAQLMAMGHQLHRQELPSHSIEDSSLSFQAGSFIPIGAAKAKVDLAQYSMM